MKLNEVGLKVGAKNLGTVSVRNQVSVSQMKSFAGSIFHSPLVESVCVYTPDGTPKLYLRKTANGVIREEN